MGTCLFCVITFAGMPFNSKLRDEIMIRAKPEPSIFQRGSTRASLNESGDLRSRTFREFTQTYPGALEKLILSGLNVLLLSSPCSQDGCLQGASVREGQSPWSLWLVVDGVQVDWGFFFWLTTGQESDSWGVITRLVSWTIKNRLRIVPGTAAGTVRRKAVTVASAICSGVGRVPL